MKKNVENSLQTNQPDYTLGIPDYICLIKLLTFRLRIPLNLKIERLVGLHGSRSYSDTVTYLRDGLTQNIKNKIGGPAAKQLFKDLEEICRINSDILGNKKSIGDYKQKLSKLIGVGEADLGIYNVFEVDRLTTEQLKSFNENSITTLLNYIQGAMNFDPKKSIYQSFEVSIGDLPILVNPIQMATCFCCRELSVKFYKKIHLAHQTEKRSLINITVQYDTKKSVNLKVNSDQSLKKHTSSLSLLYFQSNDFTLSLLDALKDTPILIFIAFSESLILKYIEKHPEKAKNASDFSGVTPLHLSCATGYLDACIALIKIGADLNAKKNDGVTALAVAANYEHYEIAHALLTAAKQQHVNLDLIRLCENPKKKQFLEFRISEIMAKMGNFRMAKLIIDDSESDPNLILQYALEYHSDVIAIELLKSNISPNIISLMKALQSCSLDTIKIMLSHYSGPTPLNQLLAIISSTEFQHGHMLMTEKIISLSPEYSSGKFAYQLIHLALSCQSYGILQRLLELLVNWRPNIEESESLLYLAMQSSSKSFVLLLQRGAYFRDPTAALQQAMKMDKPKYCQIILQQQIDWNFDLDSVSNLLYQLLENYPQAESLHNAILNLKPFYSLTTILLLDLPDPTKIQFIDHADEIAIQKPHKLDDDQVLTLQEYFDNHTLNEMIATHLLNKKIIKAQLPTRDVDESTSETEISYHNTLSAHNIPTADMMLLLPKMLRATDDTTLLNEYLTERITLLEQLKIALPAKNFQNHALSGLRSNVARLSQHTSTSVSSETSPLTEFSLFSTPSSQWIYLDSINFVDIKLHFKLAKAKLGFNHYVLCSNLDSCVRNFDATNDLSEFKGLKTSEFFLSGLTVKMIREKAFKATVKINGEVHTLDAPAELKVKSSDARLLLAELSCRQPGSATIYIPVFYLPKGLHDKRYKEGTVFSGGSMDIETTSPQKPLTY